MLEDIEHGVMHWVDASLTPKGYETTEAHRDDDKQLPWYRATAGDELEFNFFVIFDLQTFQHNESIQPVITANESAGWCW